MPQREGGIGGRSPAAPGVLYIISEARRRMGALVWLLQLRAAGRAGGGLLVLGPSQICAGCGTDWPSWGFAGHPRL